MRSSFLGLEVSKRTIQIAQKSLDITNNNLSNASTDGYTRQRVDLNSSYMTVTGKYSTKLAKLSLAGQGVNAYGVSQIRDPYVDKRYREFTAYVAEYDTKTAVLSEVEGILSDIDNTGLIKNLDDIKAALGKYAADAPTNKELASVVRNECFSMCQTLNGYATQLANLKNENIIELQNSVKEVNNIIEKISQYNAVIVGEYNITAADKIYNGETVIGEYGPNELIDERNLLIDELSYFGDIKVYDNDNGSVKVTMGGVTIIDGSKTEQVLMKDFDNYNGAVLRFTTGDDVQLASGDLKGYMDMLNGNGSYASYYQNSEYGIPYYESTLNAFAQAFSELMNGINGVTATDSSRSMFTSSVNEYDAAGNLLEKPIITAANIRISDEWMDNATMIGENLNSDGNWELSLDGTHVNTLYLGMDNNISIGRTGEFSGSVYDYCLFVDNRFAESISYYTEQYDLYSANATTLLDTRQSISGVSDTEEGVNMLNYQKWFNASSRMLTTLDQLLDKLINGTGTVGL